jgi:hypothetical protein
MHTPTQLCAVPVTTVTYPTIFLEISAANRSSCMGVASDCRARTNHTCAQISVARIPRTSFWIKYLGQLLFFHLPVLPDDHAT